MSRVNLETDSYLKVNSDSTSFEMHPVGNFNKEGFMDHEHEELPVALQNTKTAQNANGCSQIKRRDLLSIDNNGHNKKRQRFNNSESRNQDLVSGHLDYIPPDGNLDASIFPSYGDEKKYDLVKSSPMTLSSSTTNEKADKKENNSSICSPFAICEAQSTDSLLFERTFEHLPIDWLQLLGADPTVESSNSLLKENESISEQDFNYKQDDDSEANSSQQVSSSTMPELAGGNIMNKGHSHEHDPMLHPMSYNHPKGSSNETGIKTESSTYTLLTSVNENLYPAAKYEVSSHFVPELNTLEDATFVRVPRALFNKCQPYGEREVKWANVYCALDSAQKNINMTLPRMADETISKSELYAIVRTEREKFQKIEAELQNNDGDVLVAANNIPINPPEIVETPISIEGHTISRTTWADAYSKMDLKNAAVCLFEELYTQTEKSTCTISGRFCTRNDKSKVKPPKLDPGRLNVIKHALASMMKRKHTFYYDPKHMMDLKINEIATIKGALSQRLNQIKQGNKKVGKIDG